MKYFHPDFENTELPDGMHLYDDQDITEVSICKAEYRKYPGYEDNALLSALPERVSLGELESYSRIPLWLQP